MSVIKNKRTEGSLTIVTKAAELMVYTVTIASNEKHFPKRYRWCITQHIVSQAVEINNRITEANGVYVETPDDYRLRKGLQKQALAMTYSLLSMIDMAYRVFQIDADRIRYWTGLIAEIQRLLRSWRKSDDSRYANLMG